jgi:hypothetical protein
MKSASHGRDIPGQADPRASSAFINVAEKTSTQRADAPDKA